MKKLLLSLGGALLLSGLTNGLQAQNPSLQIIHNCADAAAANVKIWANGAVFENNLPFRSATATSTLPAGTYTVGVSAPTATDQSQSLAQFTVTLVNGVDYFVVANGIVSGMGYNPAATAVPFTLSTFTLSQTAPAPSALQTDLIIHHGSTDAPTVDVVAPFTGSNPVIPNVLVNNAAYGDFAGPLTLTTADYKIQIRDQFAENVVAEYSAPLQTLGLGGARLVVVASGFLTPANNSNGAAFGLWVAAPAGGTLIPLPTSTTTSTRLQAIHNCADAAAASVDVWFQSATTGSVPVLLIDNFAFRTASPFIDVPAAESLTLFIAAPTSTSAVGAIASFTYNLSNAAKYQLIASGIVSASGYSPAPAFNLVANATVRERALVGTNTDVLVFHGATDAPAVDVAAEGSGNIVTNVAYGQYNSTGYNVLPTNDYTLHIIAGTATVASYLAPLNTLALQGNAITVLASGFLNPANNSNGAAFGLWAALASGGNLVQLPTLTVTTTGISENNALTNVLSVFPNPFNNQLSVKNNSSSILEFKILDANGKIVLEQMSNAPVVDINTDSLSKGFYFMQVSDGNAIATYKIVK